MKWAESPAFLEEVKFCFSLLKKNLFAVADCVFSFSKCVLSFHLDSLYLSILIPLPLSFIVLGDKQTRSLLGDLTGATDSNYAGSIAFALGCIHCR